ncbi:hypothetical protein CBR_g39598 [Chara braunii]|uniref:Uncharacterized protein n=1 Tax=Chara braunii TaxID=69332 RepID=A0A388K187_CHABU|nr:hypothetical protein CBR_g39598 [Chara braunii]|eukprot:GBG63814.1 hypothetical protein CBR_g39598 [Chara braunii]
MLVVLAATANAAILAFVLCISAVSAFLAFFLTTLSVIYLVSLAVSAAFISILTFAAISATVCIAFTVAFLWVVVRSLKFGVQCARTMALSSGEHPMLPPTVPLSTTATTPVSLNSRGSYAKLDGFDYCGPELDGIVLTKPDASTPASMPAHPGNTRVDVPADAGAK